MPRTGKLRSLMHVGWLAQAMESSGWVGGDKTSVRQAGRQAAVAPLVAVQCHLSPNCALLRRQSTRPLSPKQHQPASEHASKQASSKHASRAPQRTGHLLPRTHHQDRERQRQNKQAWVISSELPISAIFFFFASSLLQGQQHMHWHGTHTRTHTFSLFSRHRHW